MAPPQPGHALGLDTRGVTEQLRTGGELALVAAGMAVLGYAMYLELIRAAPLRWWERTLPLAAVGLTSIVGGLLLVVR